uniref:Uncharacterized protein n=1 Tax=Haptolina ericina TaxID=156174 RepID=A0A7S3FEJ3_9EUKA|mmetsp:Transcript_67277/g.150136  ORF Transcript_67277/g.150136 Transcript_67277/m.150136 type:complete len:364 (+) Transcript_67277:46-1137(+)
MADVDESFVRRLADLNALEEEPSLMQRTYTEMRDLRAEVACMRSELQQVRALLQGLVQPQPTLPKIRQPPPTNRERMSPASIGPPSQAPTVAPTVAPPLNTQMNAAVSTGPSMPSPSPPPQRSGTTSARRDRRFSPDGTQKVARNPGGGVLSSSQATVQWEEAVVKFASILWEMDVEGALHGLLRCQPAAERFAQWLRELKASEKDEIANASAASDLEQLELVMKVTEIVGHQGEAMDDMPSVMAEREAKAIQLYRDWMDEAPAFGGNGQAATAIEGLQAIKRDALVALSNSSVLQRFVQLTISREVLLQLFTRPEATDAASLFWHSYSLPADMAGWRAQAQRFQLGTGLGSRVHTSVWLWVA